MTRTINDSCIGRRNNFDFIRFVAASLVIYSHAFPLAAGNYKGELVVVLGKFLGLSKISGGSLAVNIFFIISGFLITQSYDNRRDLVIFLKARILRLFPPLLVVLLISSFILGPLLTSLTLSDYFSHPQTYKYLSTSLLYKVEYILPGVFGDNFSKSVNGSLWTLMYEFKYYLVVGFLGFLGLLNRKIFMVGLLILSYYLPVSHPELLLYFISGALLYIFRQNIPLNRYLFFTALGAFYLLLRNGIEFHLLLAYAILYLGFLPTKRLWNFSKFGDFSYGIYIYAFPIQQIITYFHKQNISPNFNFLIAFPLTLVCAILSWHLVEKRVLKLKNVSIISGLKNKYWVKAEAG